MDSEIANTAYSAPLDQLLALGKPRAKETHDYAAKGISSEHIPELIRMATDPELHGADGGSALVWAPVHAWLALGQLRAEAAVAPLLALLHRIDDVEDDWVESEIPDVLARIGPAALEPAANYLADPNHGMWARTAAADALGNIGNAHPELRERCIAAVAAQLERFSSQDETFNAFLVSTLMNLRAVEIMPLIERAYQADSVDPSVVGYLSDVELELGLQPSNDVLGDYDPSLSREEQFAELKRKVELIQVENAMEREMPFGLEGDMTVPQPFIAPPKTGRNDPCPCGSGKKYKKCCLRADGAV